MKRKLLFAVVISIFNFQFSLSFAQKEFCHIVSDTWRQLQVEFSTDNLLIGEVTLDGNLFSTLSFDGSLPAGSVGDPSMPVFSQLVEVPLCEGFDVMVTEILYDTLKPLPHLLMPVQPSRSKSDTLRHPTVLNAKTYGNNAWYELVTAGVESVGVARDRRLARLQFAPVKYNPITGQVVVCRKATVTVSYRNADQSKTMELFERYHTPAFNSRVGVLNSLYPKSVSSTAPVRYLIVAHSMFRGHLDNFVNWKRRKGFLTDIVYTDDPSVGSDTTAIAAYIRSQYANATAANPAPTYLLLVGDNEQIPAFQGVTDDDHITDLYYATWTSGDFIPDCYYGRFSAQNVNQLAPQIAKTLMYEQYTFADPSFLDRAVMVAGVDGGEVGDFGYTHADPAMDYVITQYINGANGFSEVRYFKNDISIVPSATNVSLSDNSSSFTVRSCYNQGAGLINYSAHGSATSWGNPNFTTTHIASMTNNQKFGVVIGNCCQTNKFQVENCFGEALLRKDGYAGAVGYIGGSNSTYWGEDFYWAVGIRNYIGATMSMNYDASHPGAFDRLCHTHGEASSLWATTQGALMMVGNMAVENSSSSLKRYYWEIYHLMGDPSVMPYLTQALVMPVNLLTTIPQGYSELHVTVAPYAYVTLNDTNSHTLVASAFADASGNATLSLPATLAVGGYELAASAQHYRTAFQTVTVIPVNSSSYAFVSEVSPLALLDAGATVPLHLKIENIGDSPFTGVTVHFSADSTVFSFTVDSIHLDSIPSDGSVTVNSVVSVMVSPLVADGSHVNISSRVVIGSDNYDMNHTLTVKAPMLRVRFLEDVTILPGESKTVTAVLSNIGHATLPLSSFALLSPTSLITVSPVETDSFALAPSDNITRHFTLQASADLPHNIWIPLSANLVGSFDILHETFTLCSGAQPVETFEGGGFTFDGWTQGSSPWIVASGIAWQGGYSARSSLTLSHNQTSCMNLSFTLSHADSVNFYYKVSSERDYDKFFFYVDGNEMFSESGEVNWTRAGIFLSEGSHTLQFSYEKDFSVSNGQDCAWVDNITLPFAAQSVVFRSDVVCQGALYVLGDDTIATDSTGFGRQFIELGDSALLVEYTVLPVSRTEESFIACDSYFWNGVEYSGDTILTDRFINIFGCDSLVTLTLVIYHSVYDTVSVTINDSSYLWNDSLYNASGLYTVVLSTAEGCDSTVTLALTLTDTTNTADTTVSIGEVRNGQWEVGCWPNPTADVLYLSIPVAEAVLYDATGREVMRCSNMRILDLTPLPQGFYLLRLRTSGATTTQRIIKK